MACYEVAGAEFVDEVVDELVPWHGGCFFVEVQDNDVVDAEYAVDEPGPVIRRVYQWHGFAADQA
jgi:hypothetical protein